MSMYPSTIYRVSVKALITNDRNQVLVLKEGQDFWSLPGGGLEHGELQPDCLRREIMEELGVSDIEIGEIAYSKTFYLDRRDAWMIWVVYRATLGTTDFVFGDNVTDAKYIDAQELKNSDDMFEKSVFEVAKFVH